MILSQAVIIGRNHRLMNQNCHDHVVTGGQNGRLFGLVLDGCGSKHREPAGGDSQNEQRVTPSHNEVGAKLLGQFMAGWLKQHLSDTDQTVSLLTALYPAALHFLDSLLQQLPGQEESDRRRFIAAHLLCTIVGFIATPMESCFFWAGDGYLVHDGIVTSLDSGNRPDYPAYRLLDRKNGRFHTQSMPPLAAGQWLAVATDGWCTEQLAGLAEPRSSLLLQRWLNTQARERTLFEDDGAVAVCHYPAAA